MTHPAPQRVEYNGMPALHLRAPDGAEAIVLEYGAHVVSWKPAGGEERLYMSPQSEFGNGTAVRGGVPVLFPQFGGYGPLQQRHGFARNMPWQVVDARTGEDFAMASLRLVDNEETRAMWPHAFSLELTVSVTASRLDVEMEVLNTGEQSVEFTAALHTYFAVREVEEVELEGLRGQTCLDTLTNRKYVDSGVCVQIDQEVDRIYYDTKNALMLREPRRALAIQAENLPETVVWNPWVDRCAMIKDMPKDGFRRMLCVEAAAIRNPIKLAPQQSWWGRQTIMDL